MQDIVCSIITYKGLHVGSPGFATGHRHWIRCAWDNFLIWRVRGRWPGWYFVSMSEPSSGEAALRRWHHARARPFITICLDKWIIAIPSPLERLQSPNEGSRASDAPSYRGAPVVTINCRDRTSAMHCQNVWCCGKWRLLTANATWIF